RQAGTAQRAPGTPARRDAIRASRAPGSEVVTATFADAEIVRRVWRVLGEVQDPEIPVLSIVDLGIARHVRGRDGEVEVVITPTYSGCPAMDAIARDIAGALAAQGFGNARVTT